MELLNSGEWDYAKWILRILLILSLVWVIFS